jgi:hypothetical protein
VLDDVVGEVDVRHAEAQVGLVVAVLAASTPRTASAESARSGRASLQVDPEHLLPDAEDEPLDDAEDVVLVHERHLDVDLRELGLAVDAEVLVAEAFHDLEVPVEPGHHVELLEELRALGEREELARVHPARDEEVPRASGRVLHHHRGLELEEAGVVEVAARRLVDAVPDAQRLLERRAAQIEVAVLQALLFVVSISSAISNGGVSRG